MANDQDMRAELQELQMQANVATDEVRICLVYTIMYIEPKQFITFQFYFKGKIEHSTKNYFIFLNVKIIP